MRDDGCGKGETEVARKKWGEAETSRPGRIEPFLDVLQSLSGFSWLLPYQPSHRSVNIFVHVTITGNPHPLLENNFFFSSLFFYLILFLKHSYTTTQYFFSFSLSFPALSALVFFFFFFFTIIYSFFPLMLTISFPISTFSSFYGVFFNSIFHSDILALTFLVSFYSWQIYVLSLLLQLFES